MITVLLKAHSIHSIYQTFRLDIKQEDFALPMIGSSWDIQHKEGYLSFQVERIEPRDSSILVYSSDTKPARFFDKIGVENINIWVNQSDGGKLLVLPK